MERIHFPGQGNVLPSGAYLAHVDGHHFVTDAAASEHSTKGLDHHLVAFGLLQQEPSHTTGGVSASLHLTAIRIEDTYKRDGIGRAGLRWIDDQQLIAADTFVSIAAPNDFIDRRLVRLPAPVHDNKIIAQAMHFNKCAAARDDVGSYFTKLDMLSHRVGFLSESIP